jgi:hypothetical protein
MWVRCLHGQATDRITYLQGHILHHPIYTIGVTVLSIWMSMTKTIINKASFGTASPNPLFQNSFIGEFLFLCSHKKNGEVWSWKDSFLHLPLPHSMFQPCIKLLLKLFCQTIFLKQLNFNEKTLCKVVFKITTLIVKLRCAKCGRNSKAELHRLNENGHPLLLEKKRRRVNISGDFRWTEYRPIYLPWHFLDVTQLIAYDTRIIFAHDMSIGISNPFLHLCFSVGATAQTR